MKYSKMERQKRLKVQAVRFENELNETIKNSLNNDTFYRVLGLKSENKAEKLRRIREQVEVLSLHYNFPTKNDVANIAKLLIQMEDKIDRLEERLFKGTRVLPIIRQHQSSVHSTILIEDTLSRKAIVSKTPGQEEKLKRIKDVKDYG